MPIHGLVELAYSSSTNDYIIHLHLAKIKSRAVTRYLSNHHHFLTVLYCRSKFHENVVGAVWVILRSFGFDKCTEKKQLII